MNTSSIITSIRLPRNLGQQLDQLSHKMHRGKSWIITQALNKYLNTHQTQDLIKRAREQSLLVAKKKLIRARKPKQKSDEELWSDQMDDSGWK